MPAMLSVVQCMAKQLHLLPPSVDAILEDISVTDTIVWC